MVLTPAQRQFEMMRLYGTLLSERDDWSGTLVLAFGEQADTVPVAVSIAGGTTLLLDEDGATAKAALRRGELDFVVHTADEALRALKNEVRQGRPLGVALTGSIPSALANLADRGVQPDCLLQGALPVSQKASIRTSTDRLRSFGSPFRHLLVDQEGKWERSWIALHGKRYYAWQVRPKTLSELRAADKELLAAIPENDKARRRWIERLPRYVRDSVEGGRWAWLAEDEFDALPDWLPVSPEGRPEFQPTTL